MHAPDKTGNDNPSLQNIADRMKEMEIETKGMRKQKKEKRDDSKIWIEAEESFFRCAENLQMARLIAGVLRHPELREKLTGEDFNEVVLKAKGLASGMKTLAASLQKLRAQHLEIANKYPLRQKKHRGSAEMLDYLTVAESYMSWMEDAIAGISAPAMEIIATISESGIDLDKGTDTEVSPSEDEGKVVESKPMKPRHRPVQKKRVKRKHSRPKKK